MSVKHPQTFLIPASRRALRLVETNLPSLPRAIEVQLLPLLRIRPKPIPPYCSTTGAHRPQLSHPPSLPRPSPTMKDPRTAKRRRVSDASLDEDGDTAMQDNTTPQEGEGSNGAENTTPSRPGLRSSGRQRKAPQRFEDEPPVRTRSVRKARAAPKAAPASTSESASVAANADTGTPTRSTSGTVRPRQQSPHASETDEDDDNNYEEESAAESPEPRAKRPTRTKAKRASVRFAGARKDDVDRNRESPSPENYQDGLDDLVSMQLQHDLVREEPNGQDEDPPEEPLPAYAEQFQQFVRNGYTTEVQLLTKILIEKLNGKRLVPLQGLESEYHKVHHLLEQTVTVGEGNSMLVLGSRGSGKTAIIETAVSSLAKKHKDDFHVVRLNGFLHTDDRLALREIWRQLGRETDTEEEAGKVTSYADTMATLLALLSHPEELQGPSGNQDGTTTTAKSIIIVLDEFDLFVTHPRQTLLYNLFDIAQARKAPLAVLGVTTKVDVTEMLEKRVKSRFSHRSVYVPQPRTFEVFSEACLAGLDLEDKYVETPEGFGVEDLSIAKSDSWRAALEGWRAYLQVKHGKVVSI